MKCNAKTELKMLKEKIAELEKTLKKTDEELKVSQKRYEIAMNFSDISIFDYNIKTKKILTQPIDFQVYGMPGVIENGIEEVIVSGIIAERSKNDIRELYQKIDGGATSAATIIYANDLSGVERTLELQMVTVFDQNKMPTYAVGVRKDITDLVKLRKEREYSDLLTSELTFTYEANVTQDRIIRYDVQWAKEVGLKLIETPSSVLKELCEKFVAPEDMKMFIEKQSGDSVLAAFQRGERIINFEYRRRLDDLNYVWFEKKINLVEDQITKDINMRVYILNIDSKKKNEMKEKAKRKRYDMVLSKSTKVYEINVTKNTMNFGQDELKKNFNISVNEYHEEIAMPIILKTIHPYDKTAMANLLSSKNILESYAKGETTLVREYRRSDKEGKYNWFRCSLQIFEDMHTKDILTYAYIENINEEKEKELELLYKAQHDLMTGFYNKNVVEEKINEILLSEDGREEIHILFMIDLDYFKSVNDKFGHTFGDAVLSRTSSKIKELFRNDDILGRVGGDEFIVFMKGVQNDKLAFLKAQEICDSVTEVYVQNGDEYKVTVSIGIAIYYKHGKNYKDLYRHSDMALYDAKEHGRNRFSIYREEMQINQTSVKGIDKVHVLETKTFENNISEYVFRILYESQDKEQAINSVLELVGKHYNVSRAYIFENSDDGTYVRNTFEWCNKGIVGHKKNMFKIPYSNIGDYKSNFNAEGFFYVEDISQIWEPFKTSLQSQGIKSMIQFSILDKGEFSGFIGFDECVSIRKPENKELNDYRNFANILSVFIAQMRTFEKIEAAEGIALSIVNGLDSYTYVCSRKSHKILFANDKVLEFSHGAKLRDYCYKVFGNYEFPCPDCLMQKLNGSEKSKFVKIVYKPSLKKWFKITMSWVNWLNDEDGCLVEAVDITEFKE